MSVKRIVIVEDDPIVANFFKTICEAVGHKVAGMARDADTACSTILTQKPDSVLMDVRLIGKRDGVDVALETQPQLPTMQVIYITGSNEPETIDRINTDHPDQILIKPVTPRQLEAALR